MAAASRSEGGPMRFLPDIRYGTEQYPERVARRLRTSTLSAWMGAAIYAAYSIAQFVDPTPGLWKAAVASGVSALVMASIPMLHRLSPLAAPIGIILIGYATLFFVCMIHGTANGMQIYYPTVAALFVLFVGVEHILAISVVGALAAVLIIALEVFVPRTTGLSSDTTMFGSFLVNAFANTGMLIFIVFYALREAVRAETTAEREYQRSERLLVNILPISIAERLKSKPETLIADKYGEASILFADMAGFTARSSDTAPDALVGFLNRVFSDFDELVERHQVEKIKTTGDSYMVVSGVPTPRLDHAQALAQLALEMRDAATNLRDPLGRNVPIRIGIACGPVVAGVVGTRKFFYDVWGDAVNVASRMETTGETGKIQVSQAAYQRLKDEFFLEPRSPIEVKGKGTMQTWFLREAKAPDALAIPDAGQQHVSTFADSLPTAMGTVQQTPDCEKMEHQTR
jgi:adenylate cyclase